MKWFYPIEKKLPIAFLLLVITLVIFFNNINERSNSRQINRLVTSIYDNRLVVENYILDLTEHMHKVEEIIYSEQDDEIKKTAFNAVFLEMKNLNERYGRTELTAEEKEHFEEFLAMCSGLERQVQKGAFGEAQLITRSAIHTLKTLSNIQVKEAQVMVRQTNQLCRSYQTSSQLEIALLIVIMLVVYKLVFTYGMNGRRTKRFHLN